MTNETIQSNNITPTRTIKTQKLPAKEPTLSLTAIQRILKRNGVTKISHDALLEVRKLLLEVIDDLSVSAVKMTRHAKRKVTQIDDILLSIK